MDDLGIVERNGRYEYSDLPNGVGEDRPLDFHSPYGCSKGAADQYTIDYARIYGIQECDVSTELHLRAAAVWNRGPRMGCVVHDRGGSWQENHHLWRRQADARRASRAGFGARVRGRLSNIVKK